MNIASRRVLARAGVGAAALLAVGAVAAPAYADTTADLEAKLAGTTIAADATGKFGNLSIVNHGPSDATGITITYDLTDLDLTKVEFPLSAECGQDGDTVTCGIDPDLIRSGEDADLLLPLVRKAGATGSAGKLKVSVSSDATDPVVDNNSVTAEVAVGGSGPDLSVFAPDVYEHDENGYTDKPIPPGGTSKLVAVVLNQGDMIAIGITIKVDLPEHVSFTDDIPVCVYSMDRRSATCTVEDLSLEPLDKNPGAGILAEFDIKVSESAPGPASLTGGVVTAKALGAAPVDSMQMRGMAPTLPEGFRQATEEELKDVDPSDNTDEFAVFVAAKPGSGGSLPITGVQVGVIGGVGIAIIAVGGALLLLFRRRRIVTVASDDETTTQ